MNRVTHIHKGPNADAAHHLVTHSSLAHVTTVTADAKHHGALSTRIELTTPWPSNGERVLWDTVQALSYGDDVTVDLRACGHLDEPNRAALVEALRIALLATVDLALDEQQVTA